MARKKFSQTGEDDYMWKGVTEDDFLLEENVEPVDLDEYNMKQMTIFSANINYARQLPRLADSLKPVERRVLYSAYLIGAFPNSKRPVKSSKLLGETVLFHPHGLDGTYGAMVNMSQRWKNPAPYFLGKGNFGNAVYPDMYAAFRYTEVLLSKYAMDCFFSDFDPDCVEMIWNSSADTDEPVSLPVRFPNILVNGGMGIAVGNTYCIPPYNIKDIVDLTQKLILDPDYPKVYMVPDLPTGCAIVDDGTEMQSICDTGTGKLKMRGTITVEEQKKTWWIRITSLPWMISFRSLEEQLAKLLSEGKLQFKEVYNNSRTYNVSFPGDDHPTAHKQMDVVIEIDKTHDPYAFIEKLCKLTSVQRTVSVNFKVVLAGYRLDEEMNLRKLILSWIDERREYKRRLYLKQLQKYRARLDFLQKMIWMCEGNHAENVIRKIKQIKTEEAIQLLMDSYEFTSFQAKRVVEQRMTAFSSDNYQRYLEEEKKTIQGIEDTLEIIGSSKKIDEILYEEQEMLMKYYTPRKTEMLSPSTKRKVTDTDHVLITTKMGYYKKGTIQEGGKFPALGAFRNGDYPTERLHIRNQSSVMFFDSLGRYTCLPVSDLDTTETSHQGFRIFDSIKLNGEIIRMLEYLDPDQQKIAEKSVKSPLYLVTMTRSGYLKKTKLEEITSMRSTRNLRVMKIREGDAMIYADLLFGDSSILVYSRKGHYVTISAKNIPEQSKDSMGLQAMKPDSGDYCTGLHVLGEDDDYLVVVTERGCLKKTELEYLKSSGKRNMISYLATLDAADQIYYVNTGRKEDRLFLCSRTEYRTIPLSEIPTLSRKAKCRKIFPVPVGSNLIGAEILLEE